MDISWQRYASSWILISREPLRIRPRGRWSRDVAVTPVKRFPTKARKIYEKSQVKRALSDVADGMSVKKAANKWEIPRTIMNDMKLGRYSSNDRPGTNPILSVMEVKFLEEWILEMSVSPGDYRLS